MYSATRFAALMLFIFMLMGCPNPDSNVVHITGEIESRHTTAGSRIGGRVMEVLAEEGDTVTTGAVLLHLDDAEARALVAVAEAHLAGLEAALAKLETGATPEQLRQGEAAAAAAAAQLAMTLKGARNEEIRAAQANLDGAAARRDVAAKEFQRVKELLADEVTTPSQFDQAKAELEAAEALFESTKEQRDLVLSGARIEEIDMARAASDQAQAALDELKIGPRVEDIAVARASRDAAAADLERARVNLREMTIIAPLNGVVESLDVRPGDLVKAGPVARIVDPEDLEVDFFVGAKMLGQLRVQQEITFSADAFGAETFTGAIKQIASEGEYTPRNLQTEEERVQQVFAVTVGLDSHNGKLRPGMAVTARFPKTHGDG
jgi:multidrug resistance efflux pump